MFASCVAAVHLIVATGVSADTGLAFGIPPLQDDPVMARVAPDECLAYLSWNGTAQPADATRNHFEQLLAEEEVQLLLRQAGRRVQQAIVMMAEEESRQARMVAVQAMTWFRRFATQPAAMFLSKVKGTPDGPEIHAGLIWGVGAEAEALHQFLSKLSEELPDNVVESVEVGGTEMFRLKPGEKMPILTYGVAGAYFYAGLGDGTIEGMLERVKTEPPAWLRQLHESQSLQRPSLRFYLNARSILAQLKPLLFVMAGLDTEPILHSLGLGNLQTIASVSGLHGGRYVAQCQFDFESAPTGVLGAAIGQPLAVADLAPIPRDATFAVAARVDAEKIFTSLLAALSRIDPDLPVEIREEMAEAEEELGFRIRADLLQSLGNVLCFYHSPGEGGLLAGFSAVLGVKDTRGIKRVIDSLVALAREENRDGPRLIGELEFANQKIQFLNPTDDDFPFSPAWCLTDKHLVISPYPQNIKAFLTRDRDYQSLASVDEVQKAFRAENRPLKVVYQDTAALFDLAYPFVQIVAHFIALEFREEGVDIDISLLPSGRAIRKHLRPDVTTVVHAETRLQITSHESAPGSSRWVVLPLLALLGMQSDLDLDDVLEGLAMVLSPSRAQKQQSMNHLRHIGLAMHNYHDVHGHFPPAYSTDDKGMPLLSWRVHLLPFLEESALYERFHLDEPWNSQHNQALAELMPKVFSAPGSHAARGKTNYVTIRGPQTIFPGGDAVSMSDITDGTSNTILAAEASDAFAVTWSKPDDLRFDPMNPLRGLLGLRGAEALVGMADGSVFVVDKSVRQDAVRAALTRNGGESISIR